MPDAAIRYRFGPFVLDPAIRQLARETTPIPLPPKAFDILVLLVRTRERVISKQELLDAIWPDTAVIENTLTQRIREIRDALGDDAQEPRWVKTVSRVGYRFIGEVVEESIRGALPGRSPSNPPVADAVSRHARALDEPAGIAKRGWPPSSRGIYAAVLARHRAQRPRRVVLSARRDRLPRPSNRGLTRLPCCRSRTCRGSRIRSFSRTG